MIVVGVDGSEGGSAALDFAAREAALRGVGLRIVSAWEVPVAAYGAGFAAPIGAAPLDTVPVDAGTMAIFRDQAQQVADDASVAAKKLEPSLEVEVLSAIGQAADVLLAQSGDADMIVVGRRGLGGFKSLLLGSVSQQVVHHATCPVVVVQQP